jgi:hypothetical protein
LNFFKKKNYFLAFFLVAFFFVAFFLVAFFLVAMFFFLHMGAGQFSLPTRFEYLLTLR